MTNFRNFAPSSRFNGGRISSPAQAGDAERAFDPSGRGSLYWTASARSGLRAVLLHLRRKNVLADKNSEMLVPRWACTSLYNSIHKVCFPTLQDSPSLRGVLVYHQYGFPQRLDRIAQRCRDRGLFLIENNVNCIFDGRPTGGIGEAGLASVYSLPKMFRTLTGGTLVVRDSELAEFCAEYFRDDEPWIGRLSRFTRRLHEAFPSRATQRLQEMIYGVVDYGRKAPSSDISCVRADFAAGGVSRRKDNFALLRREFADTPFFAGLEADAIPFVAPLFGPPDFLTRLASALTRDGWESGVYRFDAARDLFEPNFVPCVPLPIHQNLGPDEFGRLIEILRREWSSYNGQ